MYRFFLFFIVLVAPMVATGKEIPKQKPELFVIERTFSEKIKSNGLCEAFLSFLDDSAIVFAPQPTNGKIFFRELSGRKPPMQLKTALSELSYSGDLGFTIGSWQSSESDSTPPTSFGHYLSIWKKSATGKWYIVLHRALHHSKPDSEVIYLPERRFDKLSKSGLSKRKGVDGDRSLSIADNVFATITGKRGLMDAFRSTAAEDFRLLREQTIPMTGIDAAKPWLIEHPDKQVWKLISSVVAESGELGYTYGEVIVPAYGKDLEQHGYYIRVWRLDSQETWKLAVDLTFLENEFR